MKKLNKLFLAAGSIAAVAAPVAAVVSCGGTKAGVASAMGETLHTSKNADIWFVADGGSVQDKSFNESGLSAVAKFGNENSKTYNYYQPSNGNVQQGYEQANRNGAKIVLGAGFAHGDSFEGGKPAVGPAASTFTGSVPFIGIDAEFSLPGSHKENLASIMYNTQEAGYLAGLYAIDYIKNHASEFTKEADGYHVATYGGVAYSTVTSWMDGFQMAVDAHGNDNSATPVKMVYVDADASKSDFSGGFGLDNASFGNVASTISDKLLDKGADIIFPVAGAQTQLTIKEIQKKHAKAKVIGVDGDLKQALNGSEYVIGSALKNITSDSIEALKAFYNAKETTWKNEYAGHVKVGTTGFVGEDSKPWAGTIADADKTKLAATATPHKFGQVGVNGFQKPDWKEIVAKAL